MPSETCLGECVSSTLNGRAMFLCVYSPHTTEVMVMYLTTNTQICMVISPGTWWNEAEDWPKFLNIHFIFVNLSMRMREEDRQWRLIFLLWILQNRVGNTQRAWIESGEEGRSEWGGWVGGVGRISFHSGSESLVSSWWVAHQLHTSQAADFSSDLVSELADIGVSQNSSYDRSTWDILERQKCSSQ